jgi:hypothetical protein
MSQKISKTDLAEARATARRQRKMSKVSQGTGQSLPWSRGQVAGPSRHFGDKDHYGSASEIVAGQGLAVVKTIMRIRDGVRIVEKTPTKRSATPIAVDPTIVRTRKAFNAVLIDQHGV